MSEKKSSKKTVAKTSKETKTEKSSQAKFGVLGKDLSSQFSSRGGRAWSPTKPGGRNGQGKP